MLVKTISNRDFPGSPVVKTSPSNAGGAGSIPSQGAKIPHASGPKNQNIKQKQYCNKFNKDFKNGPYQKKKKKTISNTFLIYETCRIISALLFSQVLVIIKDN